MTTIHPTWPDTLVDENHLIAWTAGYLTAATTIEAAAHQAGYQQCLRDIAARAIELDITSPHWKTVRSEVAARIRRRRADMEESARHRYRREGRSEYRGGPLPVWGGGDAA